MKPITKYLSEEGTEFSTPEAAQKCDAIQQAVEAALNTLPKLPEECNWRGYIQHDPAKFLAVRKALLEIAATVWDHKFIRQSIESDTVDSSWAGRIIGEMDYKTLWRAWNRISSTDKLCREWNQPYFAAHPEEGEQICRNPETAAA